MSVIFTVGYEQTDIERFVATLKAARISCVADVRAVAISRKPGFSKKKLAERLQSEGIRYEHYVELGDPKPGREAARAGDYSRFEGIYNAHLDTDAAQASLAAVRKLSRAEATCLLCFERDPKTCHRSIIASRLADGSDLVIFNLFANDPDRYVRYADKIPNFCSCEGPAAT